MMPSIDRRTDPIAFPQRSGTSYAGQHGITTLTLDKSVASIHLATDTRTPQVVVEKESDTDERHWRFKGHGQPH